jgi:hypothetical protein
MLLAFHEQQGSSLAENKAIAVVVKGEAGGPGLFHMLAECPHDVKGREDDGKNRCFGAACQRVALDKACRC